MKDADLRKQIEALIRDEIQDVINDYVDEKEQTVFTMEQTGLGFVEKEEEKDFKVNISNREIDNLIKEYKKIKKGQKSNLGQVRKMDKKGT